jgi:hypothetical protein
MKEINYTLSPVDEHSPEFDFMGDCYICIEGDGVATIERKLGGWHALTLNDGTLMEFSGDGVLFNGTLSCKKSLKHRVRVVTAGGIRINAVKER